MIEKKDLMMEFWTKRANAYHADPRANTNDVWLREVEIHAVSEIIRTIQPRTVLDFGCANGFTTYRLADQHANVKFTGVDINERMIEVAQTSARSSKNGNVSFRCVDVKKTDIGETFDLIFGVRVFQNIETVEKQKEIFARLQNMLNHSGHFYYIESYSNGYKQLNTDRSKMNLQPLPIHRHLTLLTEDFESYAAEQMDLVEMASPSSSYYMVTRLLYSYIAKINGEKIDYNHPIHQVGALLPPIGEYGPQRACLFRKKSRGREFSDD
jgi:SAM-dependent methyltransferase